MVSTSTSSNLKITHKDFTRPCLDLANAGKSVVRERIALVAAFPQDKDKFILESIQIVAKDTTTFQPALKQTEQDDMLQDNMIEYVELLYFLRGTV